MYHKVIDGGVDVIAGADEVRISEFGVRLAWRSVCQGTSFGVANVSNPSPATQPIVPVETLERFCIAQQCVSKFDGHLVPPFYDLPLCLQ